MKAFQLLKGKSFMMYFCSQKLMRGMSSLVILVQGDSSAF